MRQNLWRLLWLCLLGVTAVLAQDLDQRFMKSVAAMTSAQQSEPMVQQHLRDILWRGTTTFMHGRLADLECQPLFSLGDEALFRRGLKVDGERNLIFVRGDKAPQHIDFGYYLFPSNTWQTYLPISSLRETYWHEVQHDLLGGYTNDQHELIEDVSERSITAYAALRTFDKEIKKAQVEATGRKLDLEEERALWGSAQQAWVFFIKLYQPVRKVGVPGMSLEEYRQVTGIFFSSPSQVTDWYRAGNVKTADGTPVIPPEWVFKTDFLLAPVDLDVSYEKPVLKGTEFTQTAVVFLRGEARAVAQGQLDIQLPSEDNQCGLRVEQQLEKTVKPVTGRPLPSGPSTHSFAADLKAGNPFRITFVHLRSDQPSQKSYTVQLSYTDPGDQRKFNSSQREVTFSLPSGPQPTVKIEGATSLLPGQKTQLRAIIRGDKTGLADVFWQDLTRNRALGSGESIAFQAEDEKDYLITVKLWGRNPAGAKIPWGSASHTIKVERKKPAVTPATPPVTAPVVHVNPSQVMASDFFQLSVDVPEATSKRVAAYEWILSTGYQQEGVCARTTEPKARLQMFRDQVSAAWGVALKNSRDEEIAKVWVKDFRGLPARFEATVPANWTVTESDAGLRLTRKSSLTVKEELKGAEGNATISGDIGAGEIEVRWVEGRDIDQLYSGKPPQQWAQQGSLKSQGLVGFRTEYRGGGGLWTNSGGPQGHQLEDQLRQRWKARTEAHTEAARKEADQILASLHLSPTGQIHRIPAPAVEVPSGPPVSIKIVAPTRTLHAGQEMNVRVVVENAPGPLRYSWTGVASSREETAMVRGTPPAMLVKVQVHGPDGLLGGAELPIAVDDYQALLEGASGPVRCGQTVDLTARLLSSGRPVPSACRYRFEPAQDVRFQPAECADGKTRATFLKEGPVSIWVAVLQQENGQWATRAESRPLDFLVGPSAAKQAQALLEEASSQINAGDFDKACTLGQQAIKLEPGANLENLMQSLIARGWQAALKDDYVTARQALQAAQRLQPQHTLAKKRLQQVLQAEKVWPEVQRLGAECDRLVTAKRIQTAYPVFGRVVDLGNLLVYEHMDQHPYVQGVGRRWHAANNSLMELLKDGAYRISDLIRERHFYTVLQLVASAEEWELNPASRRSVEVWKSSAQDGLNQQSLVTRLAEESRKLLEAGRLSRPQARQRADKLTDGLTWFQAQDPRSDQLKELIAQLRREPATQTPPVTTNKGQIRTGTTSSGTRYDPNCHGDPFLGGNWCNARNNNDWLQRDFGGLYSLKEIRINTAGTDVTTKASSLEIALQDAQGNWKVVDRLVDTNINWVQLSGGGRGNSIPAYRRTLNPPFTARAFRLTLTGHGWFSASDIVLLGDRVNTSTTTPTPPPPAKASSVVAVFTNQSSQNAHIFVAGGNFGAHNRLAPGQSRQITLPLGSDGRVHFVWGRNGQVLGQAVWNGDPDHLDRYPKVVVSPQEKLIVTTGLR